MVNMIITSWLGLALVVTAVLWAAQRQGSLAEEWEPAAA
jgi:hypothetical protein